MIKMFIISFIILVIDIISKRLVVNLLIENECINIIDNFFKITYVKNTGVAFSFLDGYVGFIILMTIIILFLIFKYIKDNVSDNIEVIGYSFIIG